MNYIKYEDNRIPSYCDRIIYKGNLKITEYDIYNDNNMILLSDHLMVYAKFVYKKQKGIIFTWNMNCIKMHHVKYGIKNILDKFDLFNNEYIIFCLQESANEDNFIKVLIKLFNKSYKASISSSTSYTEQNVRIIIFHKKIGMRLDEITDFNNTHNQDIKIKIKYLGSFFKKILGTKAYVAITINDITFISCHFPVDINIKDNINYYGNNLRIDAIKELIYDFKNEENVIIIGDLNFRIKPLDNVDQLTEFLNKFNTYKEFCKLPYPTYKILN